MIKWYKWIKTKTSKVVKLRNFDMPYATPSDMGERTDRQGEKIDAHWQLEYLRNP